MQGRSEKGEEITHNQKTEKMRRMPLRDDHKGEARGGTKHVINALFKIAGITESQCHIPTLQSLAMHTTIAN